ncbi:MAG: type IIL restriction-modification enzyme MmeI [Candidatus Acidiferrales bacterium]
MASAPTASTPAKSNPTAAPCFSSANSKQRAAVEAAAQAVLDARKKFSDSALADLYDPLAMPPTLVKSHADLDRAGDICYRPQHFDNDRQRRSAPAAAAFSLFMCFSNSNRGNMKN